MTRGLFIVAMVGAILLGSPATSVAPAAAGSAVCDLKVRVQQGPLEDGGLEFYRRWQVLLFGTGFPPFTTLELRVFADEVLVHEEALEANSNGVVARDATFIGFLAVSDVPVDFLITIRNPADPASCSDSIDLVRLPDPFFDDIVFSIFLDEIEWLHDAGLVVGCGPTSFCPSRAVTRGETAVLLVRALELPATTDDFFTDDDGHRYEWAINRLGAAGIAVGCAMGVFCPDDNITRGQMASLLVAGFEVAPSDTDAFTDDESSSHESAINALAAAGFTSGCTRFNLPRFCPDRSLLRGELAGFLFRLLQ